MFHFFFLFITHHGCTHIFFYGLWLVCFAFAFLFAFLSDLF